MSDQYVKGIGRYEILEEIGRGGFAVVFKARDPMLNRVVALKVLASHLSWDPVFTERFRREAQATANLRHPHIVTIYEIDVAEGQPYIAMEYLPGRTLEELLKAEGTMSLGRAQLILHQIADALDYAHGQGVIHRDVKPSNVMVEESAQGEIQATLMDFGLVRALESRASLTTVGAILGSPEYMAPEQADPDRRDEIGPATDRYALGVVAYQMLTGQVPFPGSTPSTLVAHMRKRPPDPRSIREELPASAAQVLLKALSKSPKGRYRTAIAMVDALRWVRTQVGKEEHRQVLTQATSGEKIIANARGVHGESKPWQPQLVPFITSFPVRAWVGATVIVLALIAGSVWLGSLMSPQPGELDTGGDTTIPTAKTSTHVQTDTPFLFTSTPTVLEAGATQVWGRDNSVMVFVPAGEFWIGSGSKDVLADSDEMPEHQVYLNAFWIDRTEVTNEQYSRCVSSGRCSPPRSQESYTRDNYFGNPDFGSYPVINIDWTQANDYCNWAGKRLPTEAEWEKAARGIDRSIYPWGDVFDGSCVNFCDVNCDISWRDRHSNDGYADTAPVKSHPEGASPYGVLNMAGNVREWVQDWYDDGYYIRSPTDNPQGSVSGERRVLRGGSWHDQRKFVRAASRNYLAAPGFKLYRVGFRCARTASGQ